MLYTGFGFDRLANGDALPLSGELGQYSASQSQQTIQSTNGRDGGGCFAWGLLLAGASGLRWTLPAEKNGVWQGVAINPLQSGGNHPLIQFINSSLVPIITLTRNSGTGLIEVRKGSHSGSVIGTSSTPLGTGAYTWVSVRVTFHATNGTVRLIVGGNVELNLTGVDTAGASGDCKYFGLGSDSVSRTTRVDDWIFGDTDGSEYNDAVTSRRVFATVATNDAGPNDFTLSTGSDHYAVMDDANLNGDTDYGESTTIDHEEVVGGLNIAGIPAGVVVSAVVVRDYSKGGGSRTQLLVGTSGTKENGTSQPTDGSLYQCGSTTWRTDPDTGLAFPRADLANIKIGVKVTA